jgi:chorismate-pyruvate lyase
MIQEGTIIENEIRGKITEVEQKHNVKLSTTQKILLCIRGPITTILDVLYGEMNLFMLDQHFEKSDERIADLLKISEGDQIDYREVIVHKNGRPLVYALSYIPTSRITERIMEDLQEERLTTGKIIDKNHIETIRVIKNISIEKPTATQTELFKTQEDMLTREYIMFHDKKVVIWTKESYPLSYFKV